MSAIDSLIGALRDQAALAERGYFTLDGAEAREKLRSYQLGDPHRWIVFVLRAAILRGATAIAVRCERARVRVSFDGEPFTAEELARLWSATFTASGAAQERALGELALACNAALALRPEQLRVTAPRRDGAVILTVAPDAQESIEDDDRQTARTVVELEGGRAARPRPEAELLREVCRWASIPISLDGESIAHGTNADMLAFVEPIDGTSTGLCGLTADDQPGRVAVLQHGLRLTSREPAAMPRGCLAVVDGSGLRTDVARREPVDDGDLAALLAQACAAGRRAVLRAGAAVVDAPADVPRWLPASLRASLGAAGPWRPRGDAYLSAIAGLPLWRRADGGVVSIARAVTSGTVRYLRTPPDTPVPPEFASALVVDEAAAADLVAIVPAAIDVGLALRQAFERRARREAERELSSASRGQLGPNHGLTALASAADLARARFLERPQRWHVHPGAGLSPVCERTADDLHCALVIGSPREHGPRAADARVEVRRERRLLVELRLRAPIPDVVAIVSSSTIPAHANWSALADAATHARVLGVVADALADAVASLLRADDRSEPVRRVLAQAGAAALPGAAWLRVWGAGLGAEPEGMALLARLLAARDVLGEAAVVPWLEACHAPPFVPPLQRALADGTAGVEPPRSLRACAVQVLATLWREPLLGRGSQACGLAELSAFAEQHGGGPELRPWERAIVKELFGAEHALATVRPSPTAVTVAVAASSADASIADEATPDAVAQAPSPAGAVAATVAAAAAPEREAGRPDPARELADDVAAPDAASDAVLDDAAAPPELGSPSERVVAWVAAALHGITAFDPEVPIDPRMWRLDVRPIELPTLARVDGASVVINRSHDAVSALLESEQPIEGPLSLVVSAVYTAVNYELDAITDAHELAFLLAHARWARQMPTGSAG